MLTDVRGFGYVRPFDRVRPFNVAPLGQLDPAISTAAISAVDSPQGITLIQLFGVAVAAGLSVWLITKWLGGAR